MGLPITDFLGKGLFSPLRLNPDTGDFTRIEGENNVRQCLRDGIFTEEGQRVLDYAFGTIAHSMLFEESDIVGDLIKPSIEAFVKQYEPRIRINNINVSVNALNSSGATTVIIRVLYTIRVTNSRDSLVFPMTLQPR